MSAAATTRISPSTPWVSSPPPRSRPMSSTTPRGLPIRTPASVGQTLSPSLSGRTRSPSRDPQISSPSYFGFVIDPGSNPTDASPGRARKNWASSAAASRSAVVTSPRAPPPDSPQKFEAFLKQSESNPFNLSHGNLAHFSANATSRQSSSSNSLDSLQERKGEQNSPRPKKRPSLEEEQDPESPEHMDTDTSAPQRKSLKSDEFPPVQLFDVPDVQSPVSASSSDLSQLGRTQISHIDERHPRNSLPHNRIDPPPSALHHIHRAETLPDSLTADGPSMISPQDFIGLSEGNDSGGILLLDLRVFPQYSKSRILGALNLCIPTTLLKRPSFNVQKLAETFTKIHEREKFDGWRQARYIIVYDVSSTQLKDATSCVNILKKFISEGYEGSTLVLRGGFVGFSGSYGQFLDHDLGNEVGSSKKLSIDPTRPGTAPVAGGCLMPATQTAANPFFGNIRQNMDLADGVGQMSVTKPSTLSAKGVSELPSWLRAASDEADNGRTVAEKFLSIELAEQRRMQKALSTNISYSSSTPKPMGGVQIAGIEKGLKNRYKDMLPYDHSRVRLQNVPPGDCDYVNASHLKAEYSSKHYIASQAPVPATFEDFWRVAWEQDARVIVMLTAESEGGQRKCHPYWLPGDYGPMRLQAIGERSSSLEIHKPSPIFNISSPFSRPDIGPPERPGPGRRRSTFYTSGSVSAQPAPGASLTSNDENPHVIIRKLTLSHAGHSSEPPREITQLQYTGWPDFGAPARPAHVLSLVEHCNEIVRGYEDGRGPDEPAGAGEQPVVVHCSAGCGRTGTFCTVDSVVDMLKWQRLGRLQKGAGDPMDADKPKTKDETEKDEVWITHDEEDLVAKTVEDFRLQRLSMVQTLRQFVLCYETVLEWFVGEMPERLLKVKDGSEIRRSYHG